MNQLRLLQIYTAVSTIVLFVLTLSAFDRSSASRVEREITVERINIVDSSGRVRLQIAGSFPPRRNELAGILFTNNDGGEAGGLVYRGAKRNGKVAAGGTLTMDQYNEDQVVALQYNQDGDRKTSGYGQGCRAESLGSQRRAAATAQGRFVGSGEYLVSRRQRAHPADHCGFCNEAVIDVVNRYSCPEVRTRSIF